MNAQQSISAEMDELLVMMSDKGVAKLLSGLLRSYAEEFDATTRSAVRSAVSRLMRSRGGPLSGKSPVPAYSPPEQA